MIRLSIFSGLCLAVAHAAFAQHLPGPIPAEIIRVVDGDTVHVRAQIWINQTIEISVRVADIDTPEVYHPSCSAERELADRATEAAREFLGNTVYLHNIHNGKYAGRVVADLRHRTRGALAEHLLDLGLAVAYEADDPWCETPLPSSSLP